MLRSLKIAVVIGLATAAAVAAAAEKPAGQAQVGFLGKFLYSHSKRNSDTLWPGRDSFSTSLIGFRLDGLLTAHVGYHAELTASFDQDNGGGGFAGPANPGEIGTMGVRRISLVFDDIIPYTRVELGTFIPPLGNYIARDLHDLDLISFPLMYAARNLDAGRFGNRPAARDFSPWQQAGVNFDVQLPLMLRVNLGLWDGMMQNAPANSDVNLAKAVSAVLTFTPVEELSLAIAVWNEQYTAAYPGLARGAKRNLTMFYFYGAYKTDLLEITADFCQGNIPTGQLDRANAFASLPFEGYQVTVGYWIRPEFEALVRYEKYDPNSLDSVQVPQSRYDASQWLTLGVNYLLSPRLELSVNYIFKTELAQTIARGEPGQDPNRPGYNPKYSAQRNNLLLFQFMIWQ